MTKASAGSVIYLDWNATTPPHPDVVEAVRAASAEAWANPASVHGPGRRARAHVEDAREAVAALLGAHPRDVLLTSGGTEANNIALSSVVSVSVPVPVSAPVSAMPGLVVSRIEHPSVTRVAERLADRGVRVTWVDPGPDGVVSAAAVEEALDRALRDGPVGLVALQAVNHETGVIQPVADVAAIVHARGALLHVDAVQAVGRLPPETWAGADMIALAGHKIRGPKGIGALATKPGIRLHPMLHGGQQERGLRPGTQDPAACAGLAVAALYARTGPSRYADVAILRDRLERELIALATANRSSGAAPSRNGEGPRAPHVSNLSWPGWRGEELCAALDLEGVAVSSGSACSAGTAEPSPVLLAMVGKERASSAVRVSLGEETLASDIDEALVRWSRVLARAVRAAPRDGPRA